MAEKKPWDHLDDAIKDLWKSFLAASDETFLTLFCKSYADERIPESFLESFVSKLKNESEAGNWTLKEDPGYEFPKELMTKSFVGKKKKMMAKLSKQRKKLAEHEKKEEVAEEEIEYEKKEDVAEEEILLEKRDELVQEEELELEPPLTEAGIEQNRKAFKEKLDKTQKAKILSRDQRSQKNKGHPTK